jgi:hypothetical protein
MSADKIVVAQILIEKHGVEIRLKYLNHFVEVKKV